MATQRPESVAGVSHVDLSGSTILVTGATAGVGRETALSLGRLGADVLVHGRDEDDAAAVVSAIESAGGSAHYHLADFLHESEVRGLADWVLEQADSLDVLINNAGATFATGQLAEVGVERTMAVNHLAPFVLTNRLLDAVERAGGRIVTVASGVHSRADADWRAAESVENYDALEAYARSKLANIVFTSALDRRLETATTNCLHPGFVPGSALWRGGNPLIRWAMRALGAMPSVVQNAIGKTPRVAAATPVYLAASPAVADTSGKYFADMEPTRAASVTAEESVQEDLWEWSLDHVSLEGRPVEAED